jgi:hypothetical protein
MSTELTAAELAAIERAKRALPASGISTQLFLHLRHIYFEGIKELPNLEHFFRDRLNGYHQYGLSIFPLAVATWESFLNESCLSLGARMDSRTNVLWEMQEQVEKWNTTTKAHLVPLLLFGKTFDKATDPYQEFQRLVAIRNHITHFRMEEIPASAVKDLSQRKLTLQLPGNTQAPWTFRLSTTEMVRWSINVTVRMIKKVAGMFPEQQQPITFMLDEITEADARKAFIEAGVDPDYVHPELRQ